jgi:hypothetical protein
LRVITHLKGGLSRSIEPLLFLVKVWPLCLCQGAEGLLQERISDMRAGTDLVCDDSPAYISSGKGVCSSRAPGCERVEEAPSFQRGSFL